MVKFLQSISILCFSFLLSAQTDINMELVSQLEFGETGNDIWGFVDANGIEYAVMGTRNATRIISLEDPSNPIERAVISGDGTTWRDHKSWGNYIYSTNDQGGTDDGLMIIDMTMAPDSITHSFWTPDIELNGTSTTLRTCHNIFIDEFGVCYLAGCNIGVGGVIMLDITTDPNNPIVLGIEDDNYSHDAYAKDNILYSSEIYTGAFAMYDVSDKTNPIYLGGELTTTTFTHNAWLSDDQKYLFTTDERPNAFLDAFDVSNPDEIVRLDSYQPIETAGAGVIPHNTHYYDGYLVTSWYTDGVIVVDGSKPDNLIKVASYDTFAGGGGGFNGCWGVYPYLPSGLIIASDMNSGLFVFQPNYQRACWLEGNISSAADGSNIVGASIQINADQENESSSNASGEYKTGLATAGTYEVEVSHPDYLSKTATAVLENGVVTILDVELEERPMISITINVVDKETGEKLSNVPFVIVKDGDQSDFFLTDEQGTYSATTVGGQFLIVAQQWGYLANGIDTPTLDQSIEFTIELERGYEDGFYLDLGWTTGGTAFDGLWERGNPIGFLFNDFEVYPEDDLSGDIGDFCYVTGNQEGFPGEHDVDGGNVVLSSPSMDLSGMTEPVINISHYFVQSAAQGFSTGDSLIYYINGQTAAIFTEPALEWVPLSFNVNDFVDNLSDVNFEIVVSDEANGEQDVECFIDGFSVVEGTPSSVEEALLNTISVYPNPAQDFIQIISEQDYSQYQLLDISGKLMKKGNLIMNQKIVVSDLATGIYVLKVEGQDQKTVYKKIIIE